MERIWLGLGLQGPALKWSLTNVSRGRAHPCTKPTYGRAYNVQILESGTTGGWWEKADKNADYANEHGPSTLSHALQFSTSGCVSQAVKYPQGWARVVVIHKL